MGEYFYIVNLTKKEYIDNHILGGVKLWEVLANTVPTKLLGYLLADHISIDRADIGMGRWNGDKITIVGDYNPNEIYQKCGNGEYKDITKTVIDSYNKFIEIEEYQYKGNPRDNI